ncbi:putative phage tail protein [Pseudescherichia vulneris NBRC 102420]|uniref:Putative phage tail protein n=1 Tax=Pseudescherichia vulneris NBRC 102420 TaxID=1115515 RepID=A0A090V685_PSEVU|nr:phage tail tape measure protein [Pseudescherichia vulneris]GAL60405.1 putative phage tail protein [Pseudescherichia vulneris NBRC 102420]STQ60118.1 putative phage tail tape measure protein [Pseudescherichia vulneris]
MSDIATISLRVNTAELERGNKALDDFQQTAGAAANKADDLNSVFRAGASDQKKNTQSLKEQQQELQNLLNKISPVNRAMNELETLQASLTGFRGKGLLGDEDFGRFSAVLDTTRNKLFQVMEAETAEGQGRQKLAQETERASVAQNAFLKSLADQAATFRASRSDALEYKAALMGMSEEAAPLIQQIRQRELSIASEAEQNRLAAQELREKQTAERQAAAEASRLQSQNDNFVESLRNQAQAIGKSRAELLELKAAQFGLQQETAPYIAVLKDQEAATVRDAANKRVAAQQARIMKQAIAELEAAERAEAAEAQRAQAVRDSFTRALEEQAAAIGKTRSELLEMKAAQLGVSQQAAPFIAKLREQEIMMNGGRVSAGQYQQALRQLPSQITDVVTSLASGMPVWLVAIQQGGQIKDSFGGIGNTLKALGNMITPARLALGALATAGALVAYQFYRTGQQAEDLRKSLALTNSFSGMTANSMMRTLEAASAAGISYSSASDALNSLVKAGVPAGANFEQLTVAVSKFAKESGVSLDELAKDFEAIANDPSKGILALNEKYHFLTAVQYEHINALQEEGKYTEALAAANEAAADGMNNAASNMKESLGTVSSIIRGLTDMAKGMWDAIEGIGRTPSDNEALKTLTTRRDSIQVQISNSERTGYNRGNGKLDEWRKELNILNAQINAFTLAGDIQIAKAKGVSSAQEQHNQNLKDAIALQQGLDQGLTNREKREKAINELNRQRIRMNAAAAADPKSNVGMSDSEYKQRLANINNQYKDPKTPKAKGVTVAAGDRAEDSAQAELLALQAQLKTLQDHRSVNDTISQQRKDLYATQSKFDVLEEAARTRQLSKQEQSLLASKNQVLELARQKALLGDQITAQEQLNKRMDTASKYFTQMAEKRAGLESGATMNDRLAGRQTALSQLRSGWINAGGSLEDEGYQKELKAANDYYEAEDRLRGDWRAGFKKGWSEYLDSATNVYASMQSVAQSALGGISDMMTNLVTTGTASFKSFAASMMKMIADVINRLLVAYAVQSALGWVTGSVSSSGGSTPSGAYTSAANSGVSLYDSGGYTGPGGKFEPAGIVHKDEFVFTKEATAAIGVDNLYAMMRSAQGYASGGVVGRAPMLGLGNNAGAGNTAPVIQTTVHVDANGNASAQSEGYGDAMGRALAVEMQNAATQVVQKHIKNGGLIYNFVKGR